MRVIQAGERKMTCKECRTVFAYTEDDVETHGLLYETKTIKCPICKVKIVLSEERPLRYH